jgi:hypothetical protein
MIRKTLCIMVLSASTGLAGSGFAEGLEVTGDASVAVASAYVWRGKEINDASVIQPQIALHLDKWTISAWGTWDVKSEAASSDRTRVDVQGDYGFEWRNLQLKAGSVARIYHDDPGNKASDTYEVFAQVAAADMALYPSVTVYYDFGTINGLYASLAIGETWECNSWIDAVLDVRLGVASDGFVERFFAGPNDTDAAGGVSVSGTRGGLVDFSSSLSFPIQCKSVVIAPKVEYVTLVDSALKNAVEAAGLSADHTIISLAVSGRF